MSFTCTRGFSLTIKPEFKLAAYWTFDEVYGVNYNPATWTDKVQSAIIDGFEADSNAAGLYGRSRDMLNWGPAGYDPKLNINATNQGFTIWWWMKKTTATDPTTMQIRLDSYVDALTPSYRCYLIFTPALGQVHIHLDTFANDADPGESATITTLAPAWLSSWAAQQFVFCCITYTTADSKIRFYDGVNAALVSAATATMRTVVNGKITVSMTGSGLPVIDELGFSAQNAASSSIVSSLYNSGVGITWPAVNSL